MRKCFPPLLVVLCVVMVVHVDGKQCWSCSETWSNPCLLDPLKSTDVCDVNLANVARIRALLTLLLPDEKAGLLSNNAKGVSRLNIPAYQWWSEALHGIGGSPGVTFNGSTPFATSFPQVVTTSSSFNTTLFSLIGDAIGTEGHAFFNEHHAGLTFWTPNINIFRDPRWGRGQETPGEDPTLTAAYAAAFTGSFQGGGSFPKYLKASSCCKHYSAYDLEDWEGVDRHHFNAVVSKQDQNDTYFPAFQSCVQRGQVSSIMCSYNAVNGVPSCVNSDLLNGQLRQDWGFEGYITSDCQAVDDVKNAHHYTTSNDSTIVDSLSAGMDSDCGNFFENHLGGCIADGTCSNSVLDPALENLFGVQFRLGLFDPLENQPYSKLGVSDINTPKHQQLALEAAEQGIVLLKNDPIVLPLNPSKGEKMAVVGPNANATETLLGNYEGNAPYRITVFEGVSRFVTDPVYEPGCANVNCGSTDQFSSAAQAAENADCVILVVGLDQTVEKEGLDRYDISLPGEQEALIEVVASAAKKPIILVVMGGGCVDLSAAKANKNVGAILWTGYPGQSGGNAIARTLFGLNVPSGRLTQTFYPSSFVHEVSMFDMGMRPNPGTGNPGRGYRFYTGKPIFAFGAGMSYSKFTYSWEPSTQTSAKVVGSKINELADQTFHNLRAADKLSPILNISFWLANEGPFDATEVVLVYMRPPPDLKKHQGAPLRSLRWFRRVHTTVHNRVVVNVSIYPSDIRLAGEGNGEMFTPRGNWTVEIGQSQSSQGHQRRFGQLEFSLTVL